MIIGLFFINFFTFISFKRTSKKDYLFIFHPCIFIAVLLLIELFNVIKNFYSNFQEERKVTKEIPALIDFIKSYLLAGLLLPSALTFVLKQKKWCSPIQNSLSAICNNYAHGKSFQESLYCGINLTKTKQSYQYLCIFYLSLRLGYSTGENMTHILEKVKYKTQDRLNLERKLKMTTAQMRLQSLVIILSPFFLGFIIFLVSPEYILFFFQETVGRFLFIFMIILNVLGAYFLNRILKIR
ncbi:MAG: hypothetical protein V4591_10165 [Bdellovibrionota bacterium]